MSNMCSIGKEVNVFIEQPQQAYSENELKEQISSLFCKDHPVFVLQENTDSVALFNFETADNLDFSTVQRIRIFSEKSELIAQKEGDIYVIYIVNENESSNGIKAVPRTIKYVLRETPHNLCKGKILKYREYFIADEDGMLQKHAERLVGVER